MSNNDKMENIFVEKLIDLTGVSKEYANAQWLCLTDKTRQTPVKSAEIISKRFKLKNEIGPEEAGVCPICGGIKLDYGSVDYYNGDNIYYPYSCPECGIKEKEFFSMTFEQHIIDK